MLETEAKGKAQSNVKVKRPISRTFSGEIVRAREEIHHDLV